MRKLMIETVRQGETEIQIEIIERTTDLSRLIELGLDVRALVRSGYSEFLTAEGTQCRVIMMLANSFYNSVGGMA